MSEKATLTLRGKSYEFPVIEGSEHEVAIDISTLRSASGAITIDEAFGNTGACKSAVTFIDGDQGILRYRGYPIEQLAEKSSFLEVAYLLINGHLPEKSELESFQRSIVKHTLLHEDMKTFFEAFPPNAHPMAILSSVVCGLSTFYPGASNLRSKTEQDQAIMRLIAKLPTIAAMSYRKSRGLPIMYPDNSLSYAGNFMRMMFGFPTEPYHIDPDIERTLDVLFILHADHEQNCSTSTVRVVGSAQANLFASISAGICALWGPLHGGANQEVLEMLERIHQDGGDVKKAVAAAKDKNSGFKLMGFGHRVYKNHDPRARIIKRHADAVLSRLGINDPLLDIARRLEEAALSDSYFVERKLYPNVDFYSGIIYRALGFPTDMFTVLFALGRLPGWIAQWKEMNEQGSRITRPRQVYTGETVRDYPG
ncbi:citrate synthase [Myxococcota bacterium]|nr:citrate synthase [Myxococcota bacterium]